jgi:hypothetical protein
MHGTRHRELSLSGNHEDYRQPRAVIIRMFLWRIDKPRCLDLTMFGFLGLKGPSEPNLSPNLPKYGAQPYVGCNTSLYTLSKRLYPAFDESCIIAIEQAIGLARLGSYAEALAIFEQDLAAVKDVPILMIEKAEVYLRQRRHGDVWQTLNQGLSRLAELPGADLDREEIRLMALMVAMAAIFHRGTLAPALKEIRRTVDWLESVPVTSYSDIQVSFRIGVEQELRTAVKDGE